MAANITSVELGYVDSCESWKLESRFFPSKVGGKPAWLDMYNLPDEVKCSSCTKPCVLLCQVYAPVETKESCFHRTIFIFLCLDPECCEVNDSRNFSVYRCQLKRENDYYSREPPVEDKFWVPDIHPKVSSLCSVCGLKGCSRCGKCKITYYCSKQHQAIDWKAAHKEICGKGKKPSEQEKASILLPEFELVTQSEELTDNENENNKKSDQQRLEEFEKMVKEGKAGTLQDDTSVDAELETVLGSVEDKVFSKFKARVRQNPTQVLRYERGGSPLWVSSAHIASKTEIPCCEYCGAERQFEFQILPQLLNYLKLDTVGKSVDWGTLVIYTCAQSCDEGPAYKKEFLWKQDIYTETEKWCSVAVPESKLNYDSSVKTTGSSVHIFIHKE